MFINTILKQDLWGNSAQEYLIALGLVLGGITVVFIFRKILLARLKQKALTSGTDAEDLPLKNLERSMVRVLYLGSIFLGINYLKLSEGVSTIVNTTGIVLGTILVVKSIITGIRLALQTYLRHSNQAEQKEKQLRGVQVFLNLILWSLALVFVLDNLGVKVSSVAAGLGIGGIAVALAAQTVLGDLFNYFVIFFDKPFEIGDFLIVGDKLGVAEKIGLKTTRVAALGGEQLVFSNTDLTNSRIHNYKKMSQRRVVFKLSVVYQTSAEKLKKVTSIVREIIQNQADVTFDRGHFASYGDFSLIFEFVYYLAGPDYNKYMDTQQAINMAIFEAFEKEGIAFAFPTQTVYLEQKVEKEIQ